MNEAQKRIFAQGVAAFLDGIKECPYPMENSDGRRRLWWTGWYEAKIDKAVGHILRKTC